MELKLCDICNEEIESIDRIYFISYGEKQEGLNIGSFTGKSKYVKNGQICRNCCLEIDNFVKGLKDFKSRGRILVKRK